jgi:hypothetical protein
MDACMTECALFWLIVLHLHGKLAAVGCLLEKEYSPSRI